MNDIIIELTNNGYIVYIDASYVDGYKSGKYVFNTAKCLSTWLNVYLSRYRAKQNRDSI